MPASIVLPLKLYTNAWGKADQSLAMALNAVQWQDEISFSARAMMIEENLERTFACDPYQQMGGYVKRCLGLRVYFKIENPRGHRIQKILVDNEEIRPDRHYTATFITEQAVPKKYGRNRESRSERIIETLRTYLAKHRPLRAELKDTFVAV